MNTQYLIDQAVEGLRAATELEINWRATTNRLFAGYLTIHTGSSLIALATQVNRQVMAHHLTELVELRQAEGETLLVAGRISDEMKHVLRESKQNYADGAGNCYINSSAMLLLIQGRKASALQEVVKQPFGKSGLRVLFTLLIQADAINLSVRELAQQTGVSVGTVQQTIDYLKKSGYIVPIDAKRRKVVNLNELREQWVSRYASTLKPGLSLGHFRLPKNLTPADWRQVNLQPGTYWGGEAAADALTNNLRPGTLTLYTTEDRAGLLRTYRLLPDPAGVVEVIRLFWKTPVSDSISVPIVPPLLVYADLVVIGDPRTIEIARHLYQGYVQDNV